MKKLLFLPILFFLFGAQAQPWLRLADSLVASAEPRPVLGLFKTERQASWVLGVGGVVSMATGSWLSGRAAYSIQIHGHRGGDFDTYGQTRFAGRVLELGGASAYAIGFAYRSKRWYRRNPVLCGVGEAAFLFLLNAGISQWSYNKRLGK